MRKYILKISVALALVLGVLCGCGEVSDGYPVNINGNKITEQPKNIVCLTAAAEETAALFMEEGTSLVGVCETSGADESIARVGDFSAPDVQKIAALSCDILFTTSALPDDATEQLKLAGVKTVYISAPVTYSGIKEYYTTVAQMLAGENKAEAKVNDAMALIKPPHLDKKAKTVLVFLSATAVATPDTIISRLINCAGFKNALKKGEYYTATDYDITVAAPDVIICQTGCAEAVKAAYGDLAAVQNGAVFEADLAACRIPGKNLSSGISAIKNAVTTEETEETAE